MYLHFTRKLSCQKWWANNFVKIFVEITLARYVSEINALLCFTQTFKMACQKWPENNFGEKSLVDSGDSLCIKKLSLFLR